MFQVPLDMFPGLESLGHRQFHFNFFAITPYCFPQWQHQPAFPPAVHKVILLFKLSLLFWFWPVLGAWYYQSSCWPRGKIWNSGDFTKSQSFKVHCSGCLRVFWVKGSLVKLVWDTIEVRRLLGAFTFADEYCDPLKGGVYYLWHSTLIWQRAFFTSM